MTARSPTHIPAREAQLAATTPVATFQEYDEAAAAVQRLAEADFPIEHITIVGSDPHIVEEVTGRSSAARTAGFGALSGAWLGVLIALLLAIFSSSARDFVAILVWGLLLGAVFGAVWGLIGFFAFDRARGFTSERLVLASRYDLRVPFELVDQLRTGLVELQPAGMRVDNTGPDATYPDTAQAE